MKKTILSFALLATAMLAGATDYKGSITKTVGDATTEQQNVTVSVDANTVSVSGIQGYDALSFSTTSSYTVGHVTFYEAAGDNGFFKAEVRSDAKNAESPITAVFSLFPGNGTMETYRFGNQRYTIGQILGSNFETFHTAKNGNNTSDEPDGWHSFMSAVAEGLTATVKNKVFTTVENETRPGSTGSKSVKLVSHAILGIPANGTVTTGRLYANSIDKTDATKNNSTSDPSSTDVDAAGDPFFAPFSVCPDSVTVWVKFKQSSNQSDAEAKYATVNAVLTDATKYQDPEEKEYSNVLGKASTTTIESNDFVWQRIALPFAYTSFNGNPGAMLVTISTNAKPGCGSKSDSDPDQLYIDDFAFAYDTHLAGATFDGAAVEGFSPETTSYELHYTGDMDMSRFAFTTSGRSALVSAQLVDDATKLVAYVLGADLQTATCYTFNLVKDDVNNDEQTEYTDQLLITLNGEPQDPEETTIITTKHEDGTYDFMLKQFSFGPFLIGDVTAANVEAQEVDGYTIYTADQDADITNGDFIAEALGGKVHVKLNAQSKDGKLYAEISLPVALDEDDVIDVFAVFGTKFETGINAVKGDAKAARIYTVGGIETKQMQRGINIVKYADGTTMKVLVK